VTASSQNYKPSGKFEATLHTSRETWPNIGHGYGAMDFLTLRKFRVTGTAPQIGGGDILARFFSLAGVSPSSEEGFLAGV